MSPLGNQNTAQQPGAPPVLPPIKKPQLVMVLPESETRPAEAIRLPDNVSMSEVLERLTAHHIKDTQAYANLYETEKSLSSKKVAELIERRGLRKRTDPTNVPPFNGFVRPHFDSNEIAGIVDELKEKPGPFEMIPGEDAHGRTEAPQEMQRMRDAVNAFVTAHGGGPPKHPVKKEDAAKWISGDGDNEPLQARLGQVVKFARMKRIIFHEPHHELTPGILVLDEIFRRMVAEVSRTFAAPPAAPSAQGWLTRALPSLEEFVNGLATATGQYGSYGTYILPAGTENGASGHGDKPLRVDPSRIELFLDVIDPNSPKLVAASLIVGAWKGGTHSSGHTNWT